MFLRSESEMSSNACLKGSVLFAVASGRSDGTASGDPGAVVSSSGPRERQGEPDQGLGQGPGESHQRYVHHEGVSFFALLNHNVLCSEREGGDGPPS